MKNTLDIFRKGKDSRIAKHSAIPNDLDSTRSTLFGKFYEGIIAEWLHKHEGYEHQRGSKASVYWNDIENIKHGENEFAETLNETLVEKKKNIRANLDGLFKKDGRYYLWEAKHWAKWDEGKPIREQVRDLLSCSPWILAKKVKHGGLSVDIDGILFSWWQKFEGYEKIEEEIGKIISLSFKFYFTAEIIDDCRRGKYDWYQKLINEQKENIEEFFKELLGE
jgi:hypothetical protein